MLLLSIFVIPHEASRQLLVRRDAESMGRNLDPENILKRASDDGGGVS